MTNIMIDFNPEVIELLKQYKIDKDEGLLVLLGIFYDLDIEAIAPEEVIKAINLTKIVEKDYDSKTIKWNISLFNGQETAFDWVEDWVEGFKGVNPERKGSPRDAISRMKDFFRKYPEYRKEDVYAARDLYFRSLSNPQYCMHSHKFIFDGAGTMKKSTLLGYCEKVKTSNIIANDVRGTVID